MIVGYLPFEYTFKIKYSDTLGKSYNDRITIEPMHLMSCSSADLKSNQLLKEIVIELKSIDDDFKELDKSMKLISKETKICPICKDMHINSSLDYCFLCKGKLSKRD